MPSVPQRRCNAATAAAVAHASPRRRRCSIARQGRIAPPGHAGEVPHRHAPPRLHRAMEGDLHHPLDMRMGRYARDRELPAVSARHECTGLTDRSRGWVIHPRLPTSHPLVAEPSRHTHLEQVSPGGVSRAQGTHTQTPRMCGGSLSLCDSNPRTHRGCIWLKTQVLSPDWITRMRTPCPIAPFYGYLLWLNHERRLFPSAPASAPTPWALVGT